MNSDLHDHDNDHRHDHDLPDAAEDRLSVATCAIRELLIEKGVLSAADIQQAIQEWDQRTPVDGARVVVRAWLDPAFKARLLAEAAAALAELGLARPAAPRLVVLENTDQVHHLVTCTLCSCYPRQLLGFPPTWYKSLAYRAKAVRDPRGLLAEFGVVLPEGVAAVVVDSTADCRYLVLPLPPPGVSEMTEAALIGLVGRDSMIGVAVVHHDRPHSPMRTETLAGGSRTSENTSGRL